MAPPGEHLPRTQTHTHMHAQCVWQTDRQTQILYTHARLAGISQSDKRMDVRAQKATGLTHTRRPSAEWQVVHSERKRDAASRRNRAAKCDSTRLQKHESIGRQVLLRFSAAVLLYSARLVSVGLVSVLFFSSSRINTYTAHQQLIKQLCNWGRIWPDSQPGWVM